MNILKLKISYKLPLLITGLAATTVIITSFISLNISKQEAIRAAEEKLMALQVSRESALMNYLSSIKEDLAIMAENDYVRQALHDFMKAWEEIESAQNSPA